jgi:lon-related putative ATP-dependent protease
MAGETRATGPEGVLRRLRVPAERLRWFCDPAQLPFETTETVPALDGTVGQDRGMDALAFGLEMRPPGFNLFVAGPVGTGRTSATRASVERIAQTRPTPDEWCYVHNFKDPACPHAITLPPGAASRFRDDLSDLVDAARRELRRAFESREYRQLQEQTHRTVGEHRDRLLQEMDERARREGFALSMTPAGVAIVPIVDGRQMTADEVARLPDAERNGLRERGEQLLAIMRDVLDQVRRLENEARGRMAEQNRQVARFAVGPLLQDLLAKYQAQPLILEHLQQVHDDIVEHAAELRQEPATPEAGAGGADAANRPPMLSQLASDGQAALFDRYAVNVLVDNGDLQGAPVVIEQHPTYYNLLGRIEYRARFGTMNTDFRMIKPGALHRANGGYLVLNALDVLNSPLAWDAIKRTLRAGRIQIENIGEQVTAAPAATLRPESIPLDVKVVLIGTPRLYYQLYFLDEDFGQLFRVRADFDTEMARDDEHTASYAAFISRRVRELGLLHFDRGAVAKIAEYGARLADHQGKLSARFDQIADLVDEASHWATKDESRYVLAEHVAKAIDRKTYRSNLIEQNFRDLIEEGTIFIDSTGTRPGTVNGLSTLDIGGYVFGKPARITVQTALGGDGLINVERETRLSGRIHSKGFLILTSFLMARYAQNRPLAVSARITFEQSYSEIDGDSASSAELYALLSSLSGLPLRQDVAVTGSVSQMGEIQPVGGVNRKIEGFFDVCQARGLTGEQGVMIPAANVQNVTLREDVVEAARQERFHVWAVSTIDEGIEILTGVPAGQRRPDGSWEDGTVNARVDQRLRAYADSLKEFGRAGGQAELGDRTPAEVGPGTPQLGRRRTGARRFRSMRR